MRRALYASGGVHAAIILWVAVGGTLTRPSEEIEFDVTGVTILSAAEFERMTAQDFPAPAVVTAPPVPDLPEETPPPPASEDTPPEVAVAPDPTPPTPDPTPEAVEPAPQAEVTDTLAPLAPPSGAPDLAPDDTPTPEEAPRVAPLPAATPEPDVETAPDVIEQASTPDPAEAVVEEQQEAAPEAATTEIVTEAEEPSGGPLGPIASARPAPRPNRPAPVPAPADTPTEAAVDPMAAAIADAVADAQTQPDVPTSPGSPPISEAVRQGFMVAVRNCWNVGSLSTEAQGTTVAITFTMDRDGVPDAVSLRMTNASGGSDTAIQQAFEAGRRAILRCGINGYDLPPESYDRWQRVEIIFNPQGMRLR
ncbi:MAG: hypothetical protein NXH79_07490 [Rhodobacteraceae bacterium]|nr:hypothetical protein [Paracoccaceae bacterium]